MPTVKYLLALAGVAACAVASSENILLASDGIVPGAYIVEFEGEQSVNTLFSELREEKIDVDHRLTLSYKLFNGVSFSLKDGIDTAAAAEKIANSQRVKNVWPVREVRVPDDKIVSTGHGSIAGTSKATRPRAADNSTYDVHLLGQIDRMHAAGYTGKGIKIGIIDSGVDYNHPNLGGCFGEGCTISYGYDFIGTRIGMPYQPDEDPMDDCFGHGTHVAGIIAAQPNDLGFLGVAPDAQVGAYRTMDCLGTSTSDVMIAAFNRAYEDGSDIISASVGLEGGWPNDPWSIAIQRIVDQGVPVIVAAGNSGEAGIFSPSNPAAGRGAGSVASIDARETPVLLLGGSFEVNGEDKEEFGWVIGYPQFQNITRPLFHIGQIETNGTIVDGCASLPNDVPDLSEYIVLVGYAGCASYTQALNIIEKGGDHLMFYGLDDEPEYLGQMPPGTAGAGLTTLTQGKTWVELIENGSNVTVSITEPTTAPPFVIRKPNSLSGGLTSYFTSWGPNWDLSINPTIGAPGSKILSTFPLALGGYSVEEGTSMACPYAAAAIALIGQARGTLDWRILHGVVTSTARQLPWFDGTQVDPQGRLTPVPQGGAGLIQAWDAAHAKGIVSTYGISFNDSTNHIEEFSFNLKNTGEEEATYEIGNIPALTVYAYGEGSKNLASFPNDVSSIGAELTFSGSTVTVAPGAAVEIKVRSTPPVNVDSGRLPVYSGFITLNGTNGDNLVVPYQGVAASMIKDSQTINWSNPIGVSLARVGDRPAVPVSADTVFRFTEPAHGTNPIGLPTQPWPLARTSTSLGTAESRVDVIPLNGTAPDLVRQTWLGYESVGIVWGSGLKLSPKGAVRSTFTGILDDLTVVPAGYYRLVVSVLKVLGDPDVDEHWEVAELVPFFIEYI